MQGLVPSPPFSREVIRLLRMVACCSGCSFIHNPYCFDYSEYYDTLCLDCGSNSCCPHTNHVAVIDSE